MMVIRLRIHACFIRKFGYIFYIVFLKFDKYQSLLVTKSVVAHTTLSMLEDEVPRFGSYIRRHTSGQCKLSLFILITPLPATS